MEQQNQILISGIRVIRNYATLLHRVYRHRIRMPIWRKKEHLKWRYRVYRETLTCCLKALYKENMNSYCVYMSNHDDMHLIGYLLTSDIRSHHDGLQYLDILSSHTFRGIGGNITDIDIYQTENMVSLTYAIPNFNSDADRVVTMTRDQMAQLIRDWIAIIRDKPIPDTVIVVMRDAEGIYHIYREPIRTNRFVAGCHRLWQQVVTNTITAIRSSMLATMVYQCIRGFCTRIARLVAPITGPFYDWWMDLWMEAGGPYYIRLQLFDGSYRLNGFSDSSCYQLGRLLVETIQLNPELYYAWAVDPDQHELRIEHGLITKTDSTVTISFDPSSPDYSIHLDRSNYINLLIAWRDYISKSLPEDIAIMRRKNHFLFQIPCNSGVPYNRRI